MVAHCVRTHASGQAMIPITTFHGRRVAVFGLGSSGNATAAALVAGGAHVVAWDDSPASRLAAEKAGLPIGDLASADWSQVSALVLAPGVPLTHPRPHWTVERAHAAGVEVIGDIELFCRERRKVCPEAKFIAITGTNGKSTTTAVIAHLLRQAGHDVQLGGNIGRAILTLEPLTAERIYVVECSSFQIDLAPTIDPTVGVLLNVTPDHLDRHGTIENYAGVKERLIAGATRAVIVVDDDWTRAAATRRREAGQEIVTVSTLQDAAVTAIDSTICEMGAPVVTLSGISSLRGRHNAENAAAAFAAVRAAGLRVSDIAPHFATYPGLAHRLEQVAAFDGVLFINDSKATNAESTEKALKSFSGPIYLILGGRAKDGGIQSLRPLFSRITHAYLIGEASEAFASTLAGIVPFERCGTMDVAVECASAAAFAAGCPDSVVLLSPACASFDQYRNFEERGEHFKALVKNLIARREAQ